MSNLDLAIRVYRALEEPNVHLRQVTGVLSENIYRRHVDALTEAGLLTRNVDETRVVEFSLPSSRDEIFVLDIDDLLESTERQLTPPDAFYIASEDFLYRKGVQNVPNQLVYYFQISKFAQVLLSLADHGIRQGNPKAIFLHGEKLEISLSYDSSILKELQGLEKFVSEFAEAEIHQEQKITIIKGALLEMLKQSEIERLNLQNLVSRFSEFIERVDANYQLYVSEFSFEKIKEQLENEQFEFTLKLNQVFSSIQNQLLAIPVALILIGSQMESADSFTLRNISIWLSSIVFGTFMALLVRNQKSTLTAIRLEIDSQWQSIREKHKFVANRLGGHYSKLMNRYRVQNISLSVVSFIVSAAIACSTFFFLYSSNASDSVGKVLNAGLMGGIVYLGGCLAWWLLLTRPTENKLQKSITRS